MFNVRNVTVARVWGIPIRINVSLVVFLPILAWLIGSGEQIALYAALINELTAASLDVAVLRAGLTPWFIGVAAAVGLFASVTLHELGHSWVALRYGIGIESITLWILGGIASLSSVPREWNRELWIALAGPATSVLVAAACWVAIVPVPASLPAVTFVLGWLAITNVVLVVFNLIPAFPMDGGRVFRALLARSRPYGQATRIAGRVGVLFALLFAVVGVLSFNVILLLLAFFIYGAATSESRLVLLDELLENLTVGDVMSRDVPTVDADATVGELTDRMLRDRRTAYPVVDDGDVVGIVALEDLRGTDRDGGDAAAVRSVMRDAPRVRTTDDAFETLSVLSQGGSEHAIVEDGGTLRGLLSQSDYAHALTVQRGFRVAA